MKKIHKKSLSLFLSLVMLLSVTVGVELPVHAETQSSGSCGENVTYKFNSDTGELVISGTGPMNNYQSVGSPFHWDSKIKTVTIEYGVTSIGSYMFDSCINISDIFISNSVKTIGGHAFFNCRSLTDVVIPDGVIAIGSWAFNYCLNLSNVTLGDGLTTIYNYAFYDCKNLKSIKLGKNIKNIEADAFYNCRNLKKIYIDSLEMWFNASISEFDYQFDLFLNGKLLTNVVVPKNIDVLRYGLFGNCNSVETIEIKNDVTEIGRYAFRNCKNLVEVTIGDSVKEIGNDAFNGCSNLNRVNISNMEAWCKINFSNSTSNPLCYASNLYLNDELVTDLVIPNTITQINCCAFSGCLSLTSVTIPNSVTDIDYNAFEKCESLNNVYYYGTEDEWKEIYIGYGNECLTNAYIRYNNVIHKDFKAGSTTFSGDYGFYFSNDYFNNPSTEFNQSLATMSLCMALSTYQTKNITYENVKQLMNNCKFSYFEDYNYTQNPTIDSIGCAISKKKIDGTTLIAVAVRSGGYGAEWSSNANVGLSGDHAGFNDASSKVLKYIKSYISDYNISGDVKIWITGYSRGAATATQTAAKLNSTKISGVSFSKSDIYCYGFATPAGASKISDPHSIKYNNIFNIINYHDLVPLVAPSSDGWSFDRYGISKLLPFYENSKNTSSLETKMKKYFTNMTGKNYKIDDFNSTFLNSNASLGAFNRKLIKNVTSALGSRADYVIKYQKDAMMILSETDSGLYLSIADLLTKGFLINTDLSKINPVSLGTAIGNKDYLVEAHAQDGAYYMAWMQLMDSNYKQNVPVTYNNGNYRVVKINCPVDVYVLDNNESVIASIVNESINNNRDSTVNLEIDEDGQKLVYLPVDSNYKINVVAREKCKTTISVNEYSGVDGETSKVIAYDAISMKTQESVNLEVEQYSQDDIEVDEGTVEGSSADYELLDESEKIIEPIVNVTGEDVEKYTFNVTTSYPETYGEVIGGGVYTIGDFAQVEANAVDGCSFDGWYINDHLVSSENIYRFAVDKDTELVAKFTENEHRFNENIIDSTCTKRGYTESVCEICGLVMKTNYVDAKEHSYITTTNKATKSADGFVIIKCSDCEFVSFFKTIYKPTTYTLSTSTYTYNGSAKSPSLTIKDSNGNKLVKDTDYTVSSPSGRKNVGTYTYKITFKGNYSGTATKSFKINPVKTSISKLTATSKGFKATWSKKSTQVTGYQIQYSTSSKFTSPKTVTVSSYKTTSKTVSKLKAKKKYYVRVRTYKTVSGTKYYSSWSSYKSITTKK